MFERWIRRALPGSSPFTAFPYVVLLATLASAGLAIAARFVGDAILDHTLSSVGHPPAHFFSAMLLPVWIGTTVRITAAVRHTNEAAVRRTLFVSGWSLTACLFLVLSFGFMADGPGRSFSGAYVVFVSCFLALTVAIRVAAYGLVRVLLRAASIRSLDEWSRAARLIAVLLSLGIGVHVALGPAPQSLLFMSGLLVCVAIPNELFLAVIRRRLQAISGGTDPSYATRPLRDDESPAASRASAAESRLGIVPRQHEGYREAGDEAFARI